MATKKTHYAVKIGRNIGIYKTWAECEMQVIGFPNAKYKGFTSIEEAKEYMNQGSLCDGKKDVECLEQMKLDIFADEKADVVAYVDGSYDVERKMYSYGAVIFHGGDEFHLFKAFDDKENAKLRNVAGEVEGAKTAMKYCIEKNIETLDLYFDYQGIRAWCLGEWKTNIDFTKEYKEMYDGIKDKLTVRFHKVLAHSGDKYNELADRLAKEALGK